jgi:hypothetical protein
MKGRDNKYECCYAQYQAVREACYLAFPETFHKVSLETQRTCCISCRCRTVHRQTTSLERRRPEKVGKGRVELVRV